MKLDMASHMMSVFDLIRRDLGEGPSGVIEVSHKPTAQCWQERGFDDCSGDNQDGVTCWLKIDSNTQRSTFCFDIPEVPVSALDVLSLITEVQDAKNWFPFCRKSSAVHVLPGPLPLVRIFDVEVGVRIFSIQTIFVMAVEDQLEERGCIAVYMFSPPEPVMRSTTPTKWMGAEIPALPSGMLNFRLPWEYQRLCFYPLPEGKCRLKCDVKVIDLIPPIPPVSRFFLRECSKRIVGILTEMASCRICPGDIDQSVVSDTQRLFAFWKQRLDASSFAQLAV